MQFLKNYFKLHFDQNIVVFHPRAIGGLSRGGKDIARFRDSHTEKPLSKKG
ncbi:MAG: hypothetical protein U5K35_09595 [Rhodohalobacter sp.]|nr:hypothetical protein [Rhodohalobacter sp.]